MGVTHLAAIAAELLAGGRPAQTPAAVVTSGCTPQAGLFVTTLGRLEDDASVAGIAPPAVVVVGRVVDVLLSAGEPEPAMLEA
jgi:uroporphyrin-III C-methyltransferase/precorrin-2 dehydrogenase/sirohydrochlorin ferrochelatase